MMLLVMVLGLELLLLLLLALLLLLLLSLLHLSSVYFIVDDTCDVVVVVGGGGIRVGVVVFASTAVAVISAVVVEIGFIMADVNVGAGGVVGASNAVVAVVVRVFADGVYVILFLIVESVLVNIFADDVSVAAVAVVAVILAAGHNIFCSSCSIRCLY